MLTLGLLDWALVALLVTLGSAAAAAIAFFLARRFCVDEIVGLRNQLRLLETRQRSPERTDEGPASLLPAAKPARNLPQAAASRVTLPRPIQPAPFTPEPPVISRSMESITQAAAAALSSLEAFRRFTQQEGGNGFVVVAGSPECKPAPGLDQASTADLWAVPFENTWLLFPGYNLRRSQSSLLADSGRLARDRLGWLFDIEAGDQLAAYKPAIERAEGIEKGLLTLPF